ncbi:MAG: VTT domain-containing protein [Thermoflexales bacterium]|nr:VTT domain-containing protein [Thermoflexales bacterium]MDW8350340.1 VTT domain-containing protein [Anaerolineae bacterium]
MRKMLFGATESPAAADSERASLQPQPLPTGDSPMPEMAPALSNPHRGRAIAMLILAIVISAAVILLSARFRDALLAFGQLGLIGLFVLSVVGNATVLIPAPAFVVACAAAPIYGIVATGLVAGLGSAIGEMTGYMAGYGGTAVLPQGRIYQRMHDLMERFGPLVIFVMAVLPNPLFDVGGLIAGILKMHPLAFLFAAASGKAVRLMLVAMACNGALPFLMQFIDPQQAP